MSHPVSAPVEPLKERLLAVLSDVSLKGDQYLAEVERDLVQVDVLLDEAVKKLCASFMEIHRTVSSQHEALGRLLTEEVGQHPDNTDRLQAIQGEIERHVGAAVTGLQFQDMTSQLIRRMVTHLASLREVIRTLDAGDQGMHQSADAALLRLLAQAGAHDAACGVCDGSSRGSPVRQRHLESGDIELF
jgi:hypothetical protein